MPKRLRFLLLLLVCVALIAVVRVLTAPRYGPGHPSYTAGIEAGERGDLSMAVYHLRRAVILEPGNGDYHAELGNAYLQSRRSDLALVELQAAEFFTPDRPHLYCQEAQAFVELRRRQEAYLALEEAMRRTPDCAHALGVKAEQELRDDNFKSALETYRRLLKVSPGLPMAHQKVGFVLLAVNQVEEAIRELEKALALFPADSGINALLGEAYSRRPTDPQSSEKAIQHLQRAAESNPEAADTHTALGKLFLRKRDLQSARKEYEKALELQPGLATAQYGLAQVAGREGKSAEAEPLLKSYRHTQSLARELSELQTQATANPDKLEVQLKIARLCLQHGLSNPAARALESAVRIDPSRREVRELRAQLYRALGQPSLAAQETAVASTLK